MRNIICLIAVGWILAGGLPGPEAWAAETVRHVSNRIKIVKPPMAVASKQAPEKPAPALPAEPAPAEPVYLPETSSQPVMAEPSMEMAALSPEAESELFLGIAGKFYTREGKVDPFEPFLRVPEEEVTSEEQEKLQIRAPQTPLERFDLSQLRLTGILVAPNKIRALIQESSGKGYIVSEGTYIGNKGGQITKILNDRVVVEEKYIDVLGKIAEREVELKLRPDTD